MTKFSAIDDEEKSSNKNRKQSYGEPKETRRKEKKMFLLVLATRSTRPNMPFDVSACFSSSCNVGVKIFTYLIIKSENNENNLIIKSKKALSLWIINASE